MSDSHMGGCWQGNLAEWHSQRLECVLAVIDRYCLRQSNDKFQCHSAEHSQCVAENHAYAHQSQQNIAIPQMTD